jgi:multidrug efflux pump subunit AcrA (membrane-fusion protein)
MSVVYLVLLFVAAFHIAGNEVGIIGKLTTVFFCYLIGRSLFEGISNGEIKKMFVLRHKRLVAFGLGLAGIVTVLTLVEIEDRRTGTFLVRPAKRGEVRARVAGFLRTIHFDEGDSVGPSTVVAYQDIPDLNSRIMQKKAEITESSAKLRLLQVGPRPEEIRLQRERVARARAWNEQGQQELAQARRSLREELLKLDKQMEQHKAEMSYASYALKRDERLHKQGVVPKDQYLDRKKNHEVRNALIEQTKAERATREAKGTLEPEAEAARRAKELADAEAILRVQELGTRPEEIEAERARLARLQEEFDYLQGIREHLQIYSPVAGVITTPHLKEKIGQHLKEGDLICTVDQSKEPVVEIVMEEHDIAKVHIGDSVQLTARAFTLRRFHGHVRRIAPTTRREAASLDPSKPPAPIRPDTPGTVTVYVEVKDSEDLRPGMSGFARIYTGRRPIGSILLDRLVRQLRLEYWW